MESESLLELRVRELLDAVPARAPAPGGGSVAAIAAALAAGLTTMAARFAPGGVGASGGDHRSSRRATGADRATCRSGRSRLRRIPLRTHEGDPRPDRGDSVRARRALGGACPPGGTRRCRRQSECSRRRRRRSRARGCGSELSVPALSRSTRVEEIPGSHVHANWPSRPGTQPLRRATLTSSLVRTRPRDCPWVTARRDMLEGKRPGTSSIGHVLGPVPRTRPFRPPR